MRGIIFLIIVFALVGCSKVRTINLEPHSFSTRPQHVVWLQVSGLDNEHLAMIRFSKDSVAKKTYLEDSVCTGSIWSYNLFELRPEASRSFLSQMNGRKNLKGDCSDYNILPIWSYAEKLDYITGIFESSSKNVDFFQDLVNCSVNNQYLKDVYYWKMGKYADDAKISHYSAMEKTLFNVPSIFYDDACSTGTCYSELDSSVLSVYQRFIEGKGKTIFIVRDFAYQESLASGNVPRARELLVAIDKIYGEFVAVSKNSGNTLVLLTSAASRNLELPRRGKEWESFDLNGKGILFKNNSLISPIFAYGPGAENFCGTFEESEIMKRILWVPTKSQLEVDARNIFK